MKRGFSSSFADVATANIQRSTFNRPFNHKTTFDANMLIPVFVDEVIPGDTFKLNTTMFARLATPIKPSMDNLYLDVHYFFVPNRLVWDNWEKFMGAQDNPGDSTDYLIPTAFHGGGGSPYITNYLGVPTRYNDQDELFSVEINALPIRAYNLIWNEWYRDQNLQESILFSKGDYGQDDPIDLLPRNKRHDYFTSALPFPQKGEPVGLTLAGTAPVVTNGVTQDIVSVGSSGSEDTFGLFAAASPQDVKFGAPVGDVNLFADMDNVTAVTINALRQAFQLQRFLERDARSGTRYIEVIKAHFNVTNPDFRLQRPEYLGGTHEDLRFTTIAQTSATVSDATPQANLSAMGVVSGSKRVFNRSFTEHGYILGLASVYADLTYQQGINRMWLRQTRVDYYWPSFSHLGEQEIFNKEIYLSGDDEIDNQLFGYQERYAEYRYMPSRVSGLFSSEHPQSLDIWHYAEEFDSLPMLNDEFIRNNAPVKRNSAVPSEPDIIADFYFGLECTRPIPMFGTPGYTDRF